MTIEFNEEEERDIQAAAEERGIDVEKLIIAAVLNDLAR
jgi:hypothetical protein